MGFHTKTSARRPRLPQWPAGSLSQVMIFNLGEGSRSWGICLTLVCLILGSITLLRAPGRLFSHKPPYFTSPQELREQMPPPLAFLHGAGSLMAVTSAPVSGHVHCDSLQLAAESLPTQLLPPQSHLNSRVGETEHSLVCKGPDSH